MSFSAESAKIHVSNNAPAMQSKVLIFKNVLIWMKQSCFGCRIHASITPRSKTRLL
jgi:hypothetical protein